MSGAEHHATVDRGLKMKIKRTTKNSGTSSNKSDSTKHEIVKSGDKMSQGSDKSATSSSSSNDFSQGSGSANGGIPVEKSNSKHAMTGDKDKSPKVKSIYKKDRMKDVKPGKSGESSTGLASVSASLDAAFSQVSLEPKHGETPQGKKDNLPDPYEFNAKVEDGIGFPVKKIKNEKDKNEESGTGCVVSDQCVGTDYSSVATEINPDCLGPCEPGTSVVLDGIVWHETENGVLVVNVTWRGKTYVGTLLDTTKHDWAPPPRQSCESPVSDFETRTPKGRAKRGRASTTGTPVNEKVLEGRKLRKGRRGSSTFQAPPSPAKSDVSTPTSAGLKRKGRPPDIDLSLEKANKRSRSCSRGTPGAESPVPNLIECPEPNCGKKYRHMNGLRYHQSHAHSNQVVDGDDDTRDVCLDNEDSLMDDLDSNVDDIPSDVNSSAANNGIENMDEESNMSVKKAEEDQKDTSSNKSDSGSNVESNSAINNKNNNSSAKSDAGTAGGPQQKKDFSTSVLVSSENSVSQLPTVTVAATPLQIVSTHSVSTNFSGMVSQSKPLTMGLATPLTANIVTATPMQAAIPITVTATAAQIFDQSKPAIRPKTMANRPIMPSNMIALSSSVSVTHTNLSPVTTHMQTSTSQLKPIQPKPTVMGDSPVVNPVLLGLNRDKKFKAKKKSKDKDPSGHPIASTMASTTSHVSSFSPGVVKPPVKLDGGKHEPQGVIKVAPIVAKPIETNKSETVIQPKVDLEQKHMGANVGVIAAQVQPMKGIDLSSGRSSEVQPSVLKVTPSLHVPSTDNNKGNINDDVQSPAYSDISDANESNSPAPPPPSESPKCKLEDLPLSNKGKEGTGTQGEPNYPMYGQYYNPINMSPATHSPSGASSNSQKLMGMGKDRNPETPKSADPHGKIKLEDPKEGEKKDGGLSKSDGARMYSQADYLQHQKYIQQQHMFYMQTLPHHAQYQYMATYGPTMDPAYHMHMINSDPHYRQYFEKLMDEQRRVPEGFGSRSETDANNKSLHKSSSMEMGSGQRSSSAGPHDSNQGSHSKSRLDSSFNRELENKKSDMLGSVSKEEKERNAREKQNENHLIMKENLDIKAQMDKSRMEQQHLDIYRAQSSGMTDEQQRRLMMYKQQKYIEQQKREEQQRNVDSGKLDKKPVDIKPQITGQSSDRKEIKEEVRSDLVRRESDSKSKQGGEMDYKSAKDDKNRSQSVDRQRGLETPKSKVGLINKASSPLTPSSSTIPSSAHSPAMGVGSSYLPYMYHNQYIQSPPYSHMPIDSSHPMYRNMNPAMMYPNSYLPSQLQYRVGGMEDSIDKEKLSASQKAPSESEVKVSDSSHMPLYHASANSGHKIHELQEKGRPSPHRASPVTVKGDALSTLPASKSVPGSLDKGREFSNSPPTQRHVHTHHHTHVLEAAYPVYPYTGIISAGAGPQPPQTPPSASMPHNTFPSSK